MSTNIITKVSNETKRARAFMHVMNNLTIAGIPGMGVRFNGSSFNGYKLAKMAAARGLHGFSVAMVDGKPELWVDDDGTDPAPSSYTSL